MTKALKSAEAQESYPTRKERKCGHSTKYQVPKPRQKLATKGNDIRTMH